MSITTSCPSCKALFRLPENLAGQPVRCQKCEQIFTVPMLVTGVPAPPAPVAPEPPPEDFAPATIAEEEPKIDIVVEGKAKKEESAKPPALPKNAAVPKAPAAPLPPPRLAGLLWTLVPLALFLLGMIGAGGFAAIWVATHLGPPLRSAANPDRIDRKGNVNDGAFDHKKQADGLVVAEVKKDKGVVELKEARPVVPAQIFVDFNNRGFVQDRTDLPAWVEHGKWGNDGPYRLYRIHLKQGLNYTFGANGLADQKGQGCAPRLRILDGDLVVADKTAVVFVDHVSLSYQPTRTGDHFVWITTAERLPGQFTINVGLTPTKNILVVRDGKGRYDDERALDATDATEPNAVGGRPFKTYHLHLNAGETCKIDMSSKDFLSTLTLFDPNGQRVESAVSMRNASVVHIARQGGTYRIHAAATQSKDRGAYTLRISP